MFINLGLGQSQPNTNNANSNNNLQRNNKIDNMIISPNNQISRQIFNQINNKKQNKIKLSYSLKNPSNFYTRFLHSSQQKIKQLLMIAIRFDENSYNSTSVKLLKNGQYLEMLQQKHIYLMFSQYGVTCIRKMKTQEGYNGFKYKFNKYVYIGDFCVNNDKIIFDGQKGQLRQIIQDGNQKKYVFTVGEWRKGSIRNGQRQIYSDQNKQKQIQYYKGQFIDNKYDGQGILSTTSMNSKKQYTKTVLKGKFQCGKFIKLIDF